MHRILYFKLAILFVLWCSKPVAAQKGAYGQFLKADTAAANSYFYGGSHFTYSPLQTDFRYGGIYGQVGFNLGRLFSKKIILGVTVDFKGWKGFNSWKPSEAFKNDFNAAYLPNVSTPEDLAKAEMIKNAVNDVEDKNFQGNYFGRIGLSIAPFPRKFGSFMMTFQRGYCSFPIYGYYDNPNIDNLDSDFAFLDIGRVYSGAIYFKPFTFSKKIRRTSFTASKEDWKNYITVGLHYERFNLNESSFYGISVNDIVKKEFLDKYGIQQRFGISLGVSIY
jgi:hypothetical protein